MDWFIPEMVSGLKRNGCPDNPGIGGWIAPEYAGEIDAKDLTVGVITGNGLKATSSIEHLINETTD